MNPPTHPPVTAGGDPGRFEETLRLIATLPGPAGLEARIQAGLGAHPAPGRVLPWRGRLHPQSAWLRAAAAAAIVSVVVGGGWGIASHVELEQAGRGSMMSPSAAAPAGFSSAGAIRTPHTLDAPVVVPAAAPAAAAQQAKANDAKVPAATVKKHRVVKRAAGQKPAPPAR